GSPGTRPDRAPHIGVCRSPTWHLAAPETVALLARVEDALRRAGATGEDRELPDGVEALIDAHPLVMNAASTRSLGWEMAERRELLSEGLRERMEWGLVRSEAELAGAYDVFARTQTAFPGALMGLDVLVTPSAPGEAPPGLSWTGDPAFNFIWTSL